MVYAENYYFRPYNPKTLLLFNSELTRREFARLYGMPPREEIFLCDVPPIDFSSDFERGAARVQLVSAGRREVVSGYLGGSDKRKGYFRLVEALRAAAAAFLLLGEPGIRDRAIPEPANRSRSLSMVRDLKQFYAACDVVIVPSLFEPFGGGQRSGGGRAGHRHARSRRLATLTGVWRRRSLESGRTSQTLVGFVQ